MATRVHVWSEEEEVDDIYKQCMNDVNVDGPGQFLDSRRGKDKGFDT